jgi:MFS family permease
MLNPVALSIIAGVFTGPRERARAVGVWGSAIGITVAAGPVLGGLLVSGIGWRSVFWVDVPIGIAAIALTQRFVPELYLQDLRHFSPLRAGVMIIPLTVGQAVAANLSGRLAGSCGARLPLTLGGALLAVGGFLLVSLTARTESVYLLTAYAISIGVAVTGSIVASTGAGFISSSPRRLSRPRGLRARRAHARRGLHQQLGQSRGRSQRPAPGRGAAVANGDCR